MTTLWLIKDDGSNYQIEISYYRQDFRYSLIENEDKRDMTSICLAINNCLGIENNMKIKVKDGFLHIDFLIAKVEASKKKTIKLKIQKIIRVVGEIPLILYEFFQVHPEKLVQEETITLYQYQQKWEEKCR